MAIIKNPQTINAGKGVERRESSYTVGGDVNWYSHYEEQYGGSLKKSTIVLPWRRKWQPTPVCLPGEFHRQRSLAGYSPWGHQESDMTEQLTQTHMRLNTTKKKITQ